MTILMLLLLVLSISGVLLLRRNRTVAFIMISLPFLFVFTTWLYLEQNSNRAVNISKLPSESQIDIFICENNLQPLAIRNIGDIFTVILYENETEMGHYSLAVDNSNRISTHAAITNNNANVTPVSIGGVASGIPFVTIIINDQKILEKPHEITVEFKDGYKVTELVNNRKGIIIPNETVKNSNVGLESVCINDHGGKLLFKR